MGSQGGDGFIHHVLWLYPFHPLSGQTFPLLPQSFAWGEERVFFPDPQTHEIRSLPLTWTNLAPVLATYIRSKIRK
jgi:Family of unknown function (DUF5372)